MNYIPRPYGNIIPPHTSREGGSGAAPSCAGSSQDLISHQNLYVWMEIAVFPPIHIKTCMYAWMDTHLSIRSSPYHP